MASWTKIKKSKNRRKATKQGKLRKHKINVIGSTKSEAELFPPEIKE